MTTALVFDTVLVANRGEIACRIIGTLRRLGIRSVAVYSDADRGAKHVALADVAVRIGPASVRESYLNADAILAAAASSGARAIHPGYGFLSENAEFATACAAAGIVFVGPAVDALEIMGDKIRARRHVAEHGVAVIPGVADPGLSDDQLIAAAESVGYPLLVKPSAGGGGKGMEIVREADALPAALATARRLAGAAFGDDTLFLERLVSPARHIEVQVLADGAGNVIHLGERECSLQRRHQKVIEEAPSPLLHPDARARIGEAACAVARSVGYTGVGTVEFLVGNDDADEAFFIEMNTRLQVEHGVTELVTGVDLVEWQLRVAAGQELTLGQGDILLTGHAIEARVYAEDPERGFLPSTGSVLALREATGAGVRVDSSLLPGLVVSADYDPLLAKVMVWGEDRATALALLDRALADTTVLGVGTNIEYLRLLVADPHVQAGRLDTGLIDRRLPELAFRQPDDALYAAAALLEHASRWDAAPTGHVTEPWTHHAGWRMGEPRPSRYSFTAAAGTAVEVSVVGRPDDATVTLGGVHRARLHVSGDSLTLELDGILQSFRFARDGQTIWLGQGGFSRALRLRSREEQLVAAVAVDGPRGPEVRTPMPGTVVGVSVASGDTVEEGQTILVVEAMKMEHRVTATRSGIVTVTVLPGDVVRSDQVVASVLSEQSAGEQPS
ncbi:acetyl/propionyl/methylcrotonyl-CoA carboxylase subunit alpha [Lacisediminihabitans sp.]|uniref:acetyl/propionyl/methylcrotonyl-CoA carboxylase subunit alpha n=1 Tax=Lacisediminihabitans sp. TaxID=2787631 RepID=UPI00374CF302